jgi:uncharacterized protein
VREAGNALASYNLDKIKALLEQSGSDFTLFGGEALLMPKEDLEALWHWGFQRFGQNGIQTNGTLIDDDHIRMFKQYKVHVGMSMDGPDELNDVRWNHTLQATREATDRTQAALELLVKEGISVSLIVTLHRGNAIEEHLPRMTTWFRHLDEVGVPSARLHLVELESEDVRREWALSEDECVNAMIAFHELEHDLHRMTFDVFRDMIAMLIGDDKRTTCLWRTCDPYTTSAVQGIEGNGQRSNCSRVHKDGIDFVKADTCGYERYLALYHTPQHYGGCQGCRFFLMCKGNCPGTAIHGDWRNRTEYCGVWKRLYTHLEKQLTDRGEAPLSLSPIRQEAEVGLLRLWAIGRNGYIADVLKGDQQGANADMSHGDSHGDVPHGDSSATGYPVSSRHDDLSGHADAAYADCHRAQ